MKQIGIMMKDAMVRAILRAKDPKTVTRRVSGLQEINEQPDKWVLSAWEKVNGAYFARFDTRENKGAEIKIIRCPYGAEGDHLWVRETWRTTSISESGAMNRAIEYSADGKIQSMDREKILSIKNRVGGNWRPSIHMPRWASRITLERTRARPPERLQAITPADIIAEGVDDRTVEDIIEATAAKFKVLPEHWIHNSGDEATSYCRACGEKEVARILKKHPDADVSLDGGFGSKGDSLAFCETCGKPLDNTFTTYACENELNHFDEDGFNPKSPEDCYIVQRILGSMGWRISESSPEISTKESDERVIRLAWRVLYTSIHGPEAWDKNPWVWPVDFKRINP